MSKSHYILLIKLHLYYLIAILVTQVYRMIKFKTFKDNALSYLRIHLKINFLLLSFKNKQIIF